MLRCSSATPAVTTATADGNGHKRGDILATLDGDLADHLNEVVHNFTNCEDGQLFDSSHGQRKRGGSTYGQALCASEGVIVNSGKGAPFGDLTLLSHDKMGLQIYGTAGKAKDALDVLMKFIAAYSSTLAIPEDLVEQLALYVLVLVLNSVVFDSIPIGPQNFISPDVGVIYGAMSPRPTPTSASATPSSSSSGCPDPTNTPVRYDHDHSSFILPMTNI